MSNILREAELRGRRQRKRTLLKDVHLKARLKLDGEHVDKDNTFWRQVLWSNECEACLDLKKGQTSCPKNTIPRVNHGVVPIMLWGCFLFQV